MTKKRIIVCCDGTWNNLEMRYITNVGRLIQALLPEGTCGTETIAQTAFYDDGVGADAQGIARLWEGGLGKGIDNLIYEAYRFICVNYEDGDEICLFGFSRGAFTVRSIAGMLGRVGLVPRSNLKNIPSALIAYRSKDRTQQVAFKKRESVAANVTLLCCWDTVGALGIPDKLPYIPIDNILRRRYEFHDTELGDHIERAIHAVAIDERRKEFQATLMEKHSADAPTNLCQVWFPGDHGCVGGGSWEKRGLSNQCLLWMIEQAKEMGTCIGVDWNRLHDRAVTDHSIYFCPVTKFYYSEYDREMPSGLVKWEHIHYSARSRWEENEEYRPQSLTDRFSLELGALPKNGRASPQNQVTLSVGGSADLRVFSKFKDKPANVLINEGEQYGLLINRTQVWKDGNLDPTDVLGWNLEEDADRSKKPYENGQVANINFLKRAMINASEDNRLNENADWFELLAKIGNAPFELLGLRVPDGHGGMPFQAEFTAGSSGMLVLAANDLSSRFDIVDKFDNNQGWIWLKLTRLS